MQLKSRMFLLCFLGLLNFLSVTSGLTVVLGHTATIPCNRSCSAVEWFMGENLVYSFTNGNFTIAPEFKDRIEFSAANLRQGNASLTITITVYNDKSWYVCSCDGKKGCDHYLDILVPMTLTVVVGDKAKLPCYAKMDKLPAEFNPNIQWGKDDKLVLKLAQGKMEFGAGFEDRVSVSKEDYNRGDLSLTINDVKPSDTGLYRCFIQNEKSKHPDIVHLIVKDSTPFWSLEHYISVVCVTVVAVVAVLLWVYRRKVFRDLRCTNIYPHSVSGDDER